MRKSYVISLAEPRDVAKWMQLVDLVSNDFPGLDKEEYKSCTSRFKGKRYRFKHV
ncbi:MAG: hypothetical protein FWE27_08795 [Defluviitaleaceae bacterium]|nr:hypothetical protein [Defluviitaleaceae bacterium]